MRLHLTFIGGLVAMVLATAGASAAQDAPPEPPPQPPGDAGDGHRPGNAPGKMPRPVVEGFEQVNALDAVNLALAQAYLGTKEQGKAVDVLQEVIRAGHDKVAVGFAHLALARIYRQKGEETKADAELKQVTGPACAGALTMVLEAAGRKGAAQTAKLEEILKSAEDPAMKALILRRLSMLYAQAGNAEKLAELKALGEKVLTHKDAQAALEVEQKAGHRGPPWLGMAPGGGPGGPGNFGPPGDFGPPPGGREDEAAKPEPEPGKEIF